MSTFRRCDLCNDDDGAPGAPETRLRVLAGVNVTISDGSAFSRSRGLPAAAAKRDAANRFGMNIAGLVDAMSAHLDTDEGERFGVVDDAAAAERADASPRRWPSRLPPLARARVDEVGRVADAARDVISSGALAVPDLYELMARRQALWDREHGVASLVPTCGAA